MHLLRQLLRDDAGQNIIEYGVLAAFVSVAAVITIRTIGPLIAALWVMIITTLQ